MIVQEGDTLVVSGPVNVRTVPGLVGEFHKFASAQTMTSVCLKSVTEVDSSAVALMLEWSRDAKSRNQRMRYINTPESIKNLAKLYGVSEIVQYD